MKPFWERLREGRDQELESILMKLLLRARDLQLQRAVCFCMRSVCGGVACVCSHLDLRLEDLFDVFFCFSIPFNSPRISPDRFLLIVRNSPNNCSTENSFDRYFILPTPPLLFSFINFGTDSIFTFRQIDDNSNFIAIRKF